MTDPEWARRILDFWFGELSPDDWFSGGDHIDQLIRDRFLLLYEELAAAVPEAAYDDPDSALAAVIAFDQFPRNMFRRTARAFFTDTLALDIARNALEKEFDAVVPQERKAFLYMPFMHSEILSDQERCVSLFRSLAHAEGVKYAEEHRDIVAKFGRFPHRNRALGRESSETERVFLTQHAGYGQ